MGIMALFLGWQNLNDKFAGVFIMPALTSTISTSTHASVLEDIEEVNWLSIRNDVLAINPSLAEAID